MNITIKKGCRERKIVNFWNHVQFHPTDAIEDHWGKAVIDRIAADKAARVVRVYTMFEDIVDRDVNGNIRYHFAISDNRIDYMVEKGFDLLICFNFMPPALAEDPSQRSEQPRYKNKRIVFSRPKDYGEWQEICAEFTRHMIERYGIDRVSNWKFHCWNEPDHKYWLNDNGAGIYDEDKSREYHKLYDYFAAGIRSVTDKIQIGGPSAAWNLTFVEDFIRHVSQEKNYVTGETGSPVDFLSMHIYLSSVQGVSKGQRPDISWFLEKLIWYRDTLAKYGLGDKEIFLDEWGETSSGFMGTADLPLLEYRDNEYSSAFYAKLIDIYIKEFHKHNFNVTKMLFCLSGQHDLQKEFEGYRNFFSLNGFPKPIYNAFVLAAKLGETYIETDFYDDYMGIVPTKDENGNYKVMLYYMDEEFRNKLENCRVSLKIEGLEGEYTVKHYRIDHTMSNAYTKWCECGRIETTNQVQKEAVWYAGQLSLLYPEENISLNGSYEESVVMSQNAISFIELIKK